MGTSLNTLLTRVSKFKYEKCIADMVSVHQAAVVFN